MNKLVSTFPKNKFEEVRVQVKEFKGYDLVDLRVYTSLKEGEEKIPTGKGLSVNVSHFMVSNDLLQQYLDPGRHTNDNTNVPIPCLLGYLFKL